MAPATPWSAVGIAVPVVRILVPAVGTPAAEPVGTVAAGPAGRTVGDKRAAAGTWAVAAGIRELAGAGTLEPGRRAGAGTRRPAGTRDGRRTRRRRVVGKRSRHRTESLAAVPVSGPAVPFPVVSLAVGPRTWRTRLG